VAGSAGYLFTGQSSDWSPSQKSVFGETLITNPTATPISTATPAVPEFPSLVILTLFIVMILLSIVFVRKRIPKKSIILTALVASSRILM